MKITREIFFFAYHAQNEPRKLVPDLFLFFLKNLFEVKASGLFQYISIALNLAYNKIKLHTTLNYWSRDMLNFEFLEKGLEIVFPSYFVYDFSRKMFLMWCSINWLNFTVWLLLFLEILGNICIAIVCKPGYDVPRFETNVIFLFKPFFYMTKKFKTQI